MPPFVFPSALTPSFYIVTEEIRKEGRRQRGGRDGQIHREEGERGENRKRVGERVGGIEGRRAGWWEWRGRKGVGRHWIVPLKLPASPHQVFTVEANVQLSHTTQEAQNSHWTHLIFCFSL